MVFIAIYALKALLGDQVKDFLGEHDDDAACQRKETICPLAGVMGFQRQADLNDAKAQQDQANGADDRKHERRKVVDDAHRVFLGQRRHGAEKAGKQQRH